MSRQDKNSSKCCLITEEDKRQNPIFKIVANRIRNLTKKVHQIQSQEKHHGEKSHAEQLQRKIQIQAEITKNEQFASLYKTILVQNNLIYDRTEDLLKISTILSIGNHIKNESYCPKQCKDMFEDIYQPLFNNGNADDLAKTVHQNYLVLEKYLQKKLYYTQCRDYMTYLTELRSERKQPQQIKGKQIQQIHFQKGNVKQQSEEQTNLVLKKDNTLEKINTISKQLSMHQNLDIIGDRNEDKIVQENKFTAQKSTSDDEKLENTIEDQLQEQNKEEIARPNPKKKRNRHNKKKTKQSYSQKEALNPQRKDSETSLEATPEKYKNIRIKYIQKI